jgi:hypothetical protein
MDPEDSLYGKALRDLAAEAVKAGRLSPVPSRRTVTCVRGPADKDSLALIVRKDEGKPFVITNVALTGNVVDPTYRIWSAAGKRIGEGKAGPSEGRSVVLGSSLPAGLYRVRVAYRRGPMEDDNQKGGYYRYLSLTLPRASRWMIETEGTGGYSPPTPLTSRGSAFAYFVVPQGAGAVELRLARDVRVGPWIALMDPSRRVVGMVESTDKNHVRSPEFLIGLTVSPQPGIAIEPGVWTLAFCINNTPTEVHALKGALPYLTLAPDAVLTAEELRSLPRQWEGE